MTVGRNLAVGGSKYVESGDYLAASYYISPTEGGALSNGYGYLVAGETYTITICVTPAEGTTHFCLFMSSGMANQCDIYVSGHEIQTVSATFKATYSDGRTPVDAAYYAQCELYRHPNPLPDPGVNDLQIHWIKIEKGSEFTGWSPAPEDASGTDGEITFGMSNNAPTMYIPCSIAGPSYRLDSEEWMGFYEKGTTTRKGWLGFDRNKNFNIFFDLADGTETYSAYTNFAKNGAYLRMNYTSKSATINHRTNCSNGYWFDRNLWAPSWNNTSTKDIKTNIIPFESVKNAVEIVKNTTTYQYDLVDQVKTDTAIKKKYGFIVDSGYDAPTEIIEIDPITEKPVGVNLYSMSTINWQATKELINTVNELKLQINELKKEIELLKKG